MWKLFALLLIITAMPLYAFDLQKVEWVSCYDGDTCKFNILDSNFPPYLNPMSIRVYGVDTPEMKGNTKSAAIKSKEFTVHFIKNSQNLRLTNCKKDKYFRFDCDYIDNKKSLSQQLIANNLGVPYFGGKKQN
ncbi:MAG: thermonuclease family protein [Alphaproteobacteria bacterium]|jgi:endonuclease YncB( thermonuclease family)|nr:thermonuclease family protein [Alphaproteobacteria bacterium]